MTAGGLELEPVTQVLWSSRTSESRVSHKYVTKILKHQL